MPAPPGSFIVDRRMSSDIHSAEITFDSTAIDCDLPAGNTVRRLRNIGTARSGRLTCTCTEYMAAIDNGFRAGINIQALHSYSYSACNYRLGNRKYWKNQWLAGNLLQMRYKPRTT